MTAVEWLTEKVNSKEWQDMYIWHKEEVFKQAKEMEKQQIIESYRLGHIFHDSNDSNSAQEYYDTEYGNYQNENPKCVFESSNTNSSATICKWCGKEKWQHNEEYGKE